MSPSRSSLAFAIPAILTSLSMLGFAQVVVTPGGYATTPGPAIPAAVPTNPLVVTPSVALPGDGPAWSSSLPSAPVVSQVNPAEPSVWNPALGEYGVNSAPGTSQTANSDRGLTETHRADFIVGNSNGRSLAEIARQYHPSANANVPRKVFTNADLAALHPPNEDEDKESARQSQAQAVNTEAVGNDAPVASDQTGGNAAGLPQSDQAADSTDIGGKPSAGHKSVKNEVQRELKEMQRNKK